MDKLYIFIIGCLKKKKYHNIKLKNNNVSDLSIDFNYQDDKKSYYAHFTLGITINTYGKNYEIIKLEEEIKELKLLVKNNIYRDGTIVLLITFSIFCLSLYIEKLRKT